MSEPMTYQELLQKYPAKQKPKDKKSCETRRKIEEFKDNERINKEYLI